MSTCPKNCMEWTFTPVDFFEEPLSITTADYTLEAHNGKASATLKPSTLEPDEDIYPRIHQHLLAYFTGILVVSHKTFDLSEYITVRIHSDGRRVRRITLRAGSGTFRISAGTVDFKVTDAAGKTIADTRADRIASQRKLGEFTHRHRDDVAAKVILASYESAVNDPPNELVFLYEIRDALYVRFGGDKKACSQLGISQSAWERLSDLANNEPLTQSRHRGCHRARQAGQLRDPTPSELLEARSIARWMIEAYLAYLPGPMGRG